MSIEYRENALTAETLAGLRNQADWTHTEVSQAEKALKNTIFSVVAVLDEVIIGMGRLVGDGALIWYIQDVIVAPEYQGGGVGTAIVRRLMDYVLRESMPGTNATIGLMSAKGKEAFYQKLGFFERPNDHEGAGMMIRMKV
jgi:GNAT superfamily N-acetyltransferase